MSRNHSKEDLNRQMGVEEKHPFVREEGTLLIFDAFATRAEAAEIQQELATTRRQLANVTKCPTTDADALRVILASQKAGK